MVSISEGGEWRLVDGEWFHAQGTITIMVTLGLM
jgi:hypothetical protein